MFFVVTDSSKVCSTSETDSLGHQVHRRKLIQFQNFKINSQLKTSFIFIPLFLAFKIKLYFCVSKYEDVISTLIWSSLFSCFPYGNQIFTSKGKSVYFTFRVKVDVIADAFYVPCYATLSSTPNHFRVARSKAFFSAFFLIFLFMFLK